MATLKGRVVQVNSIVIFSDAYNTFGYLAAALKKDLNISISLVQSYMSSYDVIDELRKRVKDKTTAPPADIKPLLDSTKTIADIVKGSKDGYNKLVEYINKLTPADFEPPLPTGYKSAGDIDVKVFPNKPSQDPRRTGRLIIPGPPDAFKDVRVLTWLCNNAPLYGYIPYGDNSLYFVGVDAIKKVAKSGGDTAVSALVRKFLKNVSGLGPISVTAKTIIENKLPDVGNFPDPGNLESLPNPGVTSNDGRVLDLVVVDGQPVWRPVALAYLAMQAAAKAEGVVLHISSGFRPATGQNATVTSSKGNQIRLTTQESLRRDRSRWVGRSSFAGSDEEFIMKAKSSAYNPATAPPKISKHGTGTAIDLNTGGRTNFGPLKKDIYSWLVKNSWKYGFVRTVSSEEWHFEYEPMLAKNGPYGALREGSNAQRFYTDLGLQKGMLTWA